MIEWRTLLFKFVKLKTPELNNVRTTFRQILPLRTTNPFNAPTGKKDLLQVPGPTCASHTPTSPFIKRIINIFCTSCDEYRIFSSLFFLRTVSPIRTGVKLKIRHAVLLMFGTTTLRERQRQHCPPRRGPRIPPTT